jgi:subtilisin family serine protease
VHNDLGDHGLWTAGLIGAVGNEGNGVAGVNWTVRIRPVRVLGITGEGTNFDIAQGVLYAAGLPATGQNGALVQAPSASQIINMSLGGGAPSSTLAAAVQAAIDAGSLIVASAGNNGLDIPVFPAAFPGVMAVAAVGEDGALATYSNAGTYISVAAPGGDFRLDDNGGGGVLGPGWDFTVGAPTYLFGYGTSASAPYVSGVAALLLAQTPGLSAATLRSRIEQYATRPAGTTRSDTFGWGIVNAYNALTQRSGPARAMYARLIDATGGNAATVKVASNGTFAFTQLQPGSYRLQAGEDESDDGAIGVAGRLFNWAGGFGAPTVFTVGGQAQSAAVTIGMPMEVEPNNDAATANRLSVGSYVIGQITTPDTKDVYVVNIPVSGKYTFETSGVVGSCGFGIELDTEMSIATSTGSELGANDDSFGNPGLFCARLQASLTPGAYYVTITGSELNALAFHGRYRLEVRAGS